MGGGREGSAPASRTVCPCRSPARRGRRRPVPGRFAIRGGTVCAGCQGRYPAAGLRTVTPGFVAALEAGAAGLAGCAAAGAAASGFAGAAAGGAGGGAACGTIRTCCSQLSWQRAGPGRLERRRVAKNVYAITFYTLRVLMLRSARHQTMRAASRLDRFLLHSFCRDGGSIGFLGSASSATLSFGGETGAAQLHARSKEDSSGSYV